MFNDTSIPLLLGSAVLTWISTLIYIYAFLSPTWIPPFGLGLALGGILGALLLDHIKYKRKIKDDRIKIYSRLKGEKYRLSQSLYSLSSLSINASNEKGLKFWLSGSEYKDDPGAIEKIAKIDREDFELRKIQVELIKDLSEIRERWAKDIGYAEILFDNLNLENNILLIDNAADAIENFTNTLDDECESELYEAKVIPSPARSGGFEIECVWQNEKYKDLKKLDETLNNAVDDFLKLIRAKY